MKFDGKVVLVTGSTSGIGEEIALSFARKGANVVINGRDPKKLEAVVKRCNELSPSKQQAFGVIADVMQDSDLKNLMESTIKKFGKLDVLVNNAGVIRPAGVEDPDLMEVFDHQLRSNLRPYVYLSHLAIPYLEETKGCIVNITSAMAIRPQRGMLPSGIMDAGKEILTKSLALEVGPKGIRVNSVGPGYIKTPAYEQMGIKFEEDMKDELAKQAINKVGFPEDVARCVLFLASPKSAFITGAFILADAGWVLA